MSAQPKRITLFDERYYQVNKKYYPSVTWILDSYPKSKYFFTWVAEQGEDAEKIKINAGDRGSRIHQAIEDLLKGVTLNFNTPYYSEVEKMTKAFSEEEWYHLMSFANWFKGRNPKLAATERIVYSRKHKYAGTADAFLLIDDVLTIADWKTASAIYPTYPMQVAAYAKAVEEMTKTPINQAIIVRTGTKHKCGFEERILNREAIEKHFRDFLAVRDVWKIDHAGKTPVDRSIPVEITIHVETVELTI